MKAVGFLDNLNSLTRLHAVVTQNEVVCPKILIKSPSIEI
jgi:hypothetical protein